jgi:hypothetical protein
MSSNISRMTLKTKLMIYEYKERFSSLSPEFISDLLNINLKLVEKLFNEGELIMPSKMNKEDGRRKKKVYRGKGLLPGRGESTFHETISKKKRPMLRRTVHKLSIR